MQNIETGDEDAHRKLRKIQSYIPGFLGYGSRKSIGDADRLLRFQVSQKLGLARRELNEARASLIDANYYNTLESIDSLLGSLKRLDGAISYAEMGYLGSVADIEIPENELDQLYEHDAQLLIHVGVMLRLASDIKTTAGVGELVALKKHMSDFQAELGIVEAIFMKRMQVVSRQGT